MEMIREGQGMKRFFVMAGAGVMALVLQGALATFVPPPFCPDFGLLVLMAIGIYWRGLALGLVLAAGLGFAADLLSGSLMGQHSLLRLLVFVSSFFAGRQLNLKGALPQVLFAAGVTIFYSMALVSVSAFFMGGSGLGWGGVMTLLQHAAVNGLVAPLIYSIVARTIVWLGEEDASVRALNIEPHRGPV
jgi:cell shape-determining protein MreD